MSFNTKEKLRKCLSCLDTEKFEVIVVDNASVDGSVEMVKTEFVAVKVIQSDVNLGFGRANNLGLDHAAGALILYLNSDAYVQAGAIERLLDVFGDDQVVAAGPKLLNMDGSLQESVASRLTLGKVFLEQTFLDAIARKLDRGYWRTSQVQSEPVTAVDQVMGACIIVRASANERFDDRYFLYCEDTDLCLRLAKHGKIVYVRDAEVTHELGSSSADSRWKAVARYNLGKETYFRIHYGAAAGVVCFFLDRFGAFLRILSGVVRPEKAKIFWRVLWAKERDINPLFRKPQ